MGGEHPVVCHVKPNGIKEEVLNETSAIRIKHDEIDFLHGEDHMLETFWYYGK